MGLRRRLGVLRPRSWVERVSYAVSVVCLVLIVSMLTDRSTAVCGASAWVSRSGDDGGSWAMLSVNDRRYPKVLATVVPPGYDVSVHDMPRAGDGTDRDAHVARRAARRAGDLVAVAWTQATRRRHGTVRTPGMGVLAGPSGGLALTLAGADSAVPGDLTGGVRVALTGTVDPYGAVGDVGLVANKADAARKASAQVMFVPAGNRGALYGDEHWDVVYVPGEESEFTTMDRAERYRYSGARNALYGRDGRTPAVPVTHVADVLDWLCGYSGHQELCDTADRVREVSQLRRMADERGRAERNQRQTLANLSSEAQVWLDAHRSTEQPGH